MSFAESGASPARSLPFINKYEKAALLKERAEEIADSSALAIPPPKHTRNPVEIARIEFQMGKTPKKLVRKYPNGNFEIWEIKNLRDKNSLD